MVTWTQKHHKQTIVTGQTPRITINNNMTTINNNIAIQSHLKMEEARLYACTYPECGKTFRSKSGAFKHIRIIHNNQRHTCPHCNLQYRNSDDLHHHVIKHHNGPSKKSTEDPPPTTSREQEDVPAATSPLKKGYIKTPPTKKYQRGWSNYYYNRQPNGLIINKEDNLPFEKTLFRTDMQGSPMADFNRIDRVINKQLQATIQKLNRYTLPTAVLQGRRSPFTA